MSQDAKITLTGSLGGDPELKYTQGGVAYCKFTVACSERTKNGDQWEDRADGPTWLDVTVWRDMAENVAESLSKGDRVTVVGTLTLDVWTKEGEKRSRHTVTADSVGPDLRWARAKPAKQGRSGGSSAPRNEPTPPPAEDVPF